jgi:hypothetical protein
MVTDGQVRRLHRELDLGVSLTMAARRAGMSAKTARHYRDHQRLPLRGHFASIHRPPFGMCRRRRDGVRLDLRRGIPSKILRR